MGLKLLSKKDQDWFVFSSEGGTCRFLIRRIPLAKAQEVEYRHTGKKREMNFRKGTMPWDTEQASATNEELAAWALLDCQEVDIDVTTAALAAALGATIGDEVCLDGKLTNEKLKVAFLDEVPSLPRWILKQSASLHVRAKEEEEGED